MLRIALRGVAATLVAALVFTRSSPALAVNYVVNTLVDSSGANNCSLRDAMNAALGQPNSGSTCKTPGGITNQIGFAPGLAGGAIALQGFLPSIDHGSLSIDGPAGGITIEGGDFAYFIEISGDSRLVGFTNLKISGGSGGAIRIAPSSPLLSATTFTRCTFSGVKGTAILDFDTPLTVVNSTFSDNGQLGLPIIGTTGATTVSGSTFLNNQGDGISSGDRLKVSSTSFTSNLNAISLGKGADADIEGATFSKNASAGIALTGGTASVVNALFSNNDAGILNQAKVQVTGSTFSNNTRFGIGNDGSASGNAKTTVINSTFTGNSGGALFNMNGVVEADFCTFSANGAQTIYTYQNMNFDTATALRGNVMSGTRNCEVPFPPSRFVDQGFNIASDNSCPFSGTSRNNTDPQFDPAGLKDNGGPTPTIALQGTSPAAALVPFLQCYTQTGSLLALTTDQRGYGRPAAVHLGSCSAGAFEYGAVPRPASSFGLPLLRLPKVPPLPRF